MVASERWLIGNRFSMTIFDEVRPYEMGVIPEKTELLSGIVVEKFSKSALHIFFEGE